MSYNKLGFESGQVLTADHMNHIEEGIASVSWDSLPDKPFGEVETFGDTVARADSSEGLLVITNPNKTTRHVYKVSDATPTVNDLRIEYLIETDHPDYGGSVDSVKDHSSEPLENGLIVLYGGVIIVPESAVGVTYDLTDDGYWEITFPEKGVYFATRDASTWTKSFTIKGYAGFPTATTKTIDPKFLPEHLQFGEKTETKTLVDVNGDILSYDAVGDLYTGHVSAVDYFDLVAGQKYHVVGSVGGFEIDFEDTAYGSGKIGFYIDEDEMDWFTIESTGSRYFMYNSAGIGGNPNPVILTISTAVSEVTPLDPKYIPQSAGGGLCSFVFAENDDGDPVLHGTTFNDMVDAYMNNKPIYGVVYGSVVNHYTFVDGVDGFDGIEISTNEGSWNIMPDNTIMITGSE